MFNRIVLPLDGSELAEAAIPYGVELARRLGSELVLLHVCLPEQNLMLICIGLILIVFLRQ